jgi:hypothetical protein
VIVIAFALESHEVSCASQFVIVVYGRGNGDLGRDCNINGYDSEQCELVYRGRGTAFATLVFILMIHAFQFVSSSFLLKTLFDVGSPFLSLSLSFLPF